jgi:hypothetical protein
VRLELHAILCHPATGRVILIDDAHSFTGQRDYPKLETLLEELRRAGRRPTVEHNVIRVYPPDA